MSNRISWFGMPWWAWALIIWGSALVIAMFVSFVAPSDLWTWPNNGEEKFSGELSSYKHCDKCHLSDDGFYLNTLREDQCEAPHFVKTVSCDPLAIAKIDPTKDSILNAPPDDPTAKCTVAVPSKARSFCITGTVLEPQNTWSNFGYILAGVLILFSLPRLLGISVGVNFCLIGLSSGLYHATLKGWTQAFDVAWIYALLLSVIAYSAECIYIRYKSEQVDKDSGFHPIAQWILAGIPLAGGIAVGILKANDHWHVDSTTATVILLVVLGACIGLTLFDSWLLSPFDDDNERRYWNLGHWLRYTPILSLPRNLLAHGLESKSEWLGNFERLLFGLFMAVPAGISFWCRLSDGCGHPMCSPHSFIQAHAVWHVLGAVALWWVYDFFSQASSREDTMIKLGAFGR